MRQVYNSKALGICRLMFIPQFTAPPRSEVQDCDVLHLPRIPNGVTYLRPPQDAPYFLWVYDPEDGRQAIEGFFEDPYNTQ